MRKLPVVALLCAAVLLLVACGASEPEGIETHVMDLETGDCFNLPTEDNLEEDVVEVFDCAEPHQLEVYATIAPSEDAANEPFPGDQELDQYVYTSCYMEFEPFVGIPYEESTLWFTNFTPYAEEWDEGMQDGICLLYTFNEAGDDIAKVVGSLRDSGR